MSASYDQKPWYIKKKKNKLNLLEQNMSENIMIQKVFFFFQTLKKIIKSFSQSILALILFSLFIYFGAKFFSHTILGIGFIFFLFMILSLIGTFYFLIAQIGQVCTFFIEEKLNYSNFLLGTFYLRNIIEKSKPQKGLLAPEMLLRQFVQQVRLYSHEKNYYSQKFKDQLAGMEAHKLPDTQSNILKRRWNDVQDTLDEFDIYLSHHPQDIIQNLIVKSPKQNLDVSNIFQEIAELFESIWRPKGINIEHAIVVPLKAYINDKLLKRLLVGPWRTCVYFAPKGGNVVFSAKNTDNKILARWECQGVTFSEKFYEDLRNQNLSVNERIETGMNYLSNNPKNSNILLGLISLIIWYDLAHAIRIHFSISQGNEGMIIKVTF